MGDIDKLEKLKDSGELTAEEFLLIKNKLLKNTEDTQNSGNESVSNKQLNEGKNQKYNNYCMKCNNLILADEKFCGKCGTKIGDNITNATTNNGPKKINVIYLTIGIVIILLMLGLIMSIRNSNSAIGSGDESNTNQYEIAIKEANQNLPIYIGKTYVNEGEDLTFYITFLSTTQFKYVSKDKNGIIDDIIMNGTYEIDGNTINTVTSFYGTYIRESYTIVDKNTIKTNGSNASVYRIKDK